jgi:hypothetical protein
MININDLLAKYNLKYSELMPEEVATLEKWSKGLASHQITLPDIKEHIGTMIDTIEREITGYESPPNFVAWFYRRKRMRHLHARLANLIVLRDFCSAPEKAQAFVEKQLAQMADQK